VKGVRRKEDPWNAIIAGFFTGGSLAIRGGYKATRNGAIGCAVLLAVIEGVGIGFQRMLAGSTKLEVSLILLNMYPTVISACNVHVPHIAISQFVSGYTSKNGTAHKYYAGTSTTTERGTGSGLEYTITSQATTSSPLHRFALR
jgi:hypothetical protein